MEWRKKGAKYNAHTNDGNNFLVSLRCSTLQFMFFFLCAVQCTGAAFVVVRFNSFTLSLFIHSTISIYIT